MQESETDRDQVGKVSAKSDGTTGNDREALALLKSLPDEGDAGQLDTVLRTIEHRPESISQRVARVLGVNIIKLRRNYGETREIHMLAQRVDKIRSSRRFPVLPLASTKPEVVIEAAKATSTDWPMVSKVIHGLLTHSPKAAGLWIAELMNAGADEPKATEALDGLVASVNGLSEQSRKALIKTLRIRLARNGQLESSVSKEWRDIIDCGVSQSKSAVVDVAHANDAGALRTPYEGDHRSEKPPNDVQVAIAALMDENGINTDLLRAAAECHPDSELLWALLPPVSRLCNANFELTYRVARLEREREEDRRRHEDILASARRHAEAVAIENRKRVEGVQAHMQSLTLQLDEARRVVRALEEQKEALEGDLLRSESEAQRLRVRSADDYRHRFLTELLLGIRVPLAELCRYVTEWGASKDTSERLAASHISDLMSALGREGAHMVGWPGQSLQFDASMHTYIDRTSLEPGIPCSVVEPGWVVKIGGHETVIHKAKVQSQKGSGKGCQASL